MLTLVDEVRLIADDGGLKAGWILLDDDRISAVDIGSPPVVAGAMRQAGGGAIALPGFIDLHCHGGGGASYLSGSTDQARRAASTHLSHGTTTSLASLVSAAPAALIAQIEALVPLVDDGTLHGIHLEGPWLASAYCGAHDPTVLRCVDPTELAALLTLGAGRISMVTIAPEVDGALAAIPRVTAAGAIVAIGHTGADAALITAAVDAGAQVATHIFNAMPPLHHRAPGPVGTLLLDDRVVVELIADLQHIHADVLALAIRLAGPDRVALVTDAIAAADAGDGAWRLGDLAVDVSGGVARLRDGGALAGSTLTQDAALRHVVQDVGLGLGVASQMLSRTPARVLGLSDRGTIAPGQRADLALLDDALSVIAVFRGGVRIN